MYVNEGTAIGETVESLDGVSDIPLSKAFWSAVEIAAGASGRSSGTRDEYLTCISGPILHLGFGAAGTGIEL